MGDIQNLMNQLVIQSQNTLQGSNPRPVPPLIAKVGEHAVGRFITIF